MIYTARFSAGAPQAGDIFNVFDTDKEAREVANKREQLIREQKLRTKKHVTLDEIGRRLALGSFKELNIVLKGDVDGSIEALSDSMEKLSTDEISVNIIHRGVGQITESDVLLASASEAIIIGFQVRPSSNARLLAGLFYKVEHACLIILDPIKALFASSCSKNGIKEA